MHVSTRRTLGVTGALATAMILLVVAPRQRVGGRHRRLGAQVHERGLRQPRSHLTARHRRSHSGSGVAMRIIITRGVSQVPLSAWGQRNAGNLLDVRRSTTRGERDVGCSQSCSKTWCDAPGRLRRAETVGLCMPRLHGTCETRCERLDGPRAAHNPEVGGSNPPPATTWNRDRGLRTVGGLCAATCNQICTQPDRMAPRDGSRRVANVERSRDGLARRQWSTWGSLAASGIHLD
jgi:hypothetical protein